MANFGRRTLETYVFFADLGKQQSFNIKFPMKISGSRSGHWKNNYF